MKYRKKPVVIEAWQWDGKETKTMTEELKSCSFCGGEAIINEIEPHTHVFATFMPDYGGSTFIECTGCTCAISGRTREETIAAWNRRFYYGKNYKKRNSRV